MDFLQYQVETTRTSFLPTGIPVQTIEGVVSVRDISWEEDSDNITVTTDTQVHMLFEFPNFKLFISIPSGPSLSIGNVLRVLNVQSMYRLISSVWLVHSRRQVLSEVSV